MPLPFLRWFVVASPPPPPFPPATHSVLQWRIVVQGIGGLQKYFAAVSGQVVAVFVFMAFREDAMVAKAQKTAEEKKKE